MKFSTKLSLLAVVTLSALTATAARANIIITGTPGQAGGTIQITTEQTLTMAVAGNVYAIIFEGLSDSFDGASDQLTIPNFVLALNGMTQSGTLKMFDNVGLTLSNGLTPEDGYAEFPVGPTSVGAVFTIPVQTVALGTIPAGFNPSALGTFKGKVYIVDSAGNILSKIYYNSLAEQYAAKAVELYNLYAGQGRISYALGAYFENISLSKYYFYADLGDVANAELNKYIFRGSSQKFYLFALNKRKQGRAAEFVNLAIGYQKFWTLKRNPAKARLFFQKYQKLAAAARK